MVNKATVCGKLSLLREKYRLLQELSHTRQREFLSDPIKIGAAERLLQVCIEACLDIGHHLIASLGFPRPAEYRDIFRILGEQGVVPQDFSIRLQQMASFRNRLVHLYAEIDPKEVYRFLQNDIADFGLFARYLVDYLKL